jgi:hypothetical protein
LIDLNDLLQVVECLKTLAHPHRLRMMQTLLGAGRPQRLVPCRRAVSAGHHRLHQEADAGQGVGLSRRADAAPAPKRQDHPMKGKGECPLGLFALWIVL